MLIRIEKCNGTKAVNNRLHGMTGIGVNTSAVWVFDGQDIEVHNNTISSCANGIMQKTGPNIGNKYYYNLIHTITAYGIYLNEQFEAGQQCQVFQNIIINSGIGIHLEGVTSSRTVNNYLVFNNTISGVHSGITLTEFCRDAEIWNNIVHNANSPFVRYYDGLSLPSYSDYNNYFHPSEHRWILNYSTAFTSLVNWTTSTNLDVHSVTTDPEFANTNGTNSTDYKRATYTANGRGGDHQTVMGAWLSDSSPTAIGWSAE